MGLIDARRGTRPGRDGARRYLTDSERHKALVKASNGTMTEVVLGGGAKQWSRKLQNAQLATASGKARDFGAFFGGQSVFRDVDSSTKDDLRF